MSRSNDRKSLCEESMLVFVNILKLSSLSLARRTLIPTSDEDNDQLSAPKRTKISTRKAVIDKGNTRSLVPNPQKHSSKRSQKPEQAPTSKYLMVPDKEKNVDGKFSDYINRFHEKAENDHQNAIVEGKAADFIKRFHEKNMNDLNNESRRRSYVIPPPPRQVFK